jgi:hypothetical protein
MMIRIAVLRVVLAIFTAVAAPLAMPRIVRAQSAGDGELQSLVNDTAFQLKLTYRHSAAELAARYDELQAAVTAWNASSRSEADNRELAEWLREAIRASMPGSPAALPAVPKFEPPARERPPEELPAPAMPQVPPAAMGREESTGEPPALLPSASQSDRIENEAPLEQTLMRPTSSPSMLSAEQDAQDADVETSTNVDDSVEATDDFWSDHPASDELPEELSSGDPFVDDPLPELDELFE